MRRIIAAVTVPPQQAGKKVRAVYEGLPGNPSVGVTFR